MALNPNPVQIHESSSIPDTFCCHLAKMERLGTVTRLIFTVPETPNCPGSGGVEHIVVAKLIVPNEMIPAIVTVLAGAYRAKLLTDDGETNEENRALN
jgi:hypothetical protein